MADILIDGATSMFTPTDLWTRWLVFTSTDVGYIFFTGSDRDLYYRKTSDGGATWGARVTIRVGVVAAVDAWYDRWTPGDSGTKIHLSFLDANNNRYYGSLDTATDTLSTPVAYSNTATFLTSTWAFRNTSITKARGGNLYIASAGDSSLSDCEFWRSTDGGVNWTQRTTLHALGADLCILMPGDEADDQDIGACYWDASPDLIAWKRFDDSTNTWGSTAVASGHVESDDTVQWSAAIRHSDNHVILTAWNMGPSHGLELSELKVYDIHQGTVVQKTSIFSGIVADKMGSASLFIDQSNDYLYVVEIGKSDQSEAYGSAVNVYIVVSTDGGATWSAQALLSTSAATNIQQIVTDMMGYSVGLIYAVYYNGSLLGNSAIARGGGELETPTTGQFVLMLAEEATPNDPELNITPFNAAEPGQVLTQVERGRERAVLGEPPRAGAGSTWLANEEMSRYDVEHPLPGLSIRLNKFVDGIIYHLWTGPIDVPKHKMTIYRDGVSIKAFGPMSRLAGRKVTTSLYEGITTGTAIDALLDAAGYPSGANYRDIDTGVTLLNYWWLTEADALQELNKLVATEGITAEIYEDGFGRIVFRDRNARYTETRSTVVQNTIRSQDTEPLFSDHDYESGWREVVNQATHIRKTRLADADPSVVWSEASNYLLAPNAEITIYATASEPFKDAITPVLDTDYNVAWGAVTPTLDRTSGSRVGITFTAGPIGAAFGFNNTTLTAMQLRATSIPQLGSDIVEENTIPATASIAQYGLRPWSGELWPDVEWWVMRDLLDGIVAWKQLPRGRITIEVQAVSGPDQDLLTAERDIGDRLRIIEAYQNVDAEVWIEGVKHEIRAPSQHIATYECSVIAADITSNPFDDIDNQIYVGPETLGGDAATMSFVGVGVGSL